MQYGNFYDHYTFDSRSHMLPGIFQVNRFFWKHLNLFYDPFIYFITYRFRLFALCAYKAGKILNPILWKQKFLQSSSRFFWRLRLLFLWESISAEYSTMKKRFWISLLLLNVSCSGSAALIPPRKWIGNNTYWHFSA